MLRPATVAASCLAFCWNVKEEEEAFMVPLNKHEVHRVNGRTGSIFEIVNIPPFQAQEQVCQLFCSNNNANTTCLALLTSHGRVFTWLVQSNQINATTATHKTKFEMGMVTATHNLSVCGLIGINSPTCVAMLVLHPPPTAFMQRKSASSIIEFKLTPKPKTSYTCVEICSFGNGTSLAVVALGMSDGSLTVFQFKPDSTFPHDQDEGIKPLTIVNALDNQGDDGGPCDTVCWNGDCSLLLTTNTTKQATVLWAYNKTTASLQALRVLPESGSQCAFHAAFPHICFVLQSHYLARVNFQTNTVLGAPLALSIPLPGSTIAPLTLVPLPPSQNKPQPPPPSFPARTATTRSSNSNNGSPASAKRNSLSSLLSLASNRSSAAAASTQSPKPPEQMSISSPITTITSLLPSNKQQACFFTESPHSLLLWRQQQEGEMLELLAPLPVVGCHSFDLCFEANMEEDGLLYMVERPFSRSQRKRTELPSMINRVVRIKNTTMEAVIVCSEEGVFVLNNSIIQDYEQHALDVLVLSESRTVFAIHTNNTLVVKDFDQFVNEINASHQIKRMFALERGYVFVCKDFVCMEKEIDWKQQDDLTLHSDFALESDEIVLDCQHMRGKDFIVVQTSLRLVVLNLQSTEMVNEHVDTVTSITSTNAHVLFTTRSNPAQVFSIDENGIDLFCTLHGSGGGGGDGPWQVLKAMDDSLVLARRKLNGDIQWLCRPLQRFPLRGLPPRFAPGTSKIVVDAIIARTENPRQAVVACKETSMEDLFTARQWWPLYRACVARLGDLESTQWLLKMQLALSKNEHNIALVEAVNAVVLMVGETNAYSSLGTNTVVADTANQNPCIELQGFTDWFGMEHPVRIPNTNWQGIAPPTSAALSGAAALVLVKELKLDLSGSNLDETTSCVGYWRFEENEDFPETSRDLSRYKNHARLFGEYTLRGGDDYLQFGDEHTVPARALLLEHGQGWMQVIVYESLDLASSALQDVYRQAFTFETWFRAFTRGAKTTNAAAVLAERCGMWSLELRDDHKTLAFVRIGEVWTTTVDVLLQRNVWAHIALTYSIGSRPRLFFNGKELVLRRSDMEVSPMIQDDGDDDVLRFGRGINGELLEMRFWAVERQPGDIAANMRRCLTLATKTMSSSPSKPFPSTDKSIGLSSATPATKRKLVVLEEEEEDELKPLQFVGETRRDDELVLKRPHAAVSPKASSPPAVRKLAIGPIQQQPVLVEDTDTGGEEEEDDDDWKSVIDPTSGSKYYYNTKTADRVWTDPRGRDAGSPWDKIFDKTSRNYYYYNRFTGSTTWNVHDTDL